MIRQNRQFFRQKLRKFMDTKPIFENLNFGQGHSVHACKIWAGMYENWNFPTALKMSLQNKALYYMPMCGRWLLCLFEKRENFDIRVTWHHDDINWCHVIMPRALLAQVFPIILISHLWKSINIWWSTWWEISQNDSIQFSNSTFLHEDMAWRPFWFKI